MSWQRNKIDNLEKQLKVRSGQLLKALGAGGFDDAMDHEANSGLKWEFRSSTKICKLFTLLTIFCIESEYTALQ
jgi:hypothetical protein